MFWLLPRTIFASKMGWIDGAVRDTIYLAAGQTKGDEANTVLVSKRLEKALVAFAATYPRHITNPNAALFFSAKRGGFSAQTIVNLFAHFYALAGTGSTRKFDEGAEHSLFVAVMREEADGTCSMVYETSASAVVNLALHEAGKSQVLKTTEEKQKKQTANSEAAANRAVEKAVFSEAA